MYRSPYESAHCRCPAGAGPPYDELVHKTRRLRSSYSYGKSSKGCAPRGGSKREPREGFALSAGHLVIGIARVVPLWSTCWQCA